MSLVVIVIQHAFTETSYIILKALFEQCTAMFVTVY